MTHPEVTRYFMSISEAVQLLLAAAVVPEAANRIRMLEMGEPVRILELAENLIRLAGFRPKVDDSIARLEPIQNRLGRAVRPLPGVAMRTWGRQQ